MKKNWKGERLESFIFSRDAIDHIHRYALVIPYITDKIVLDIACGEGYGSNLMSKTSKLVYSVDIDEQTIEDAKLKYKRKNLKFIQGNTSKIPIDNYSVDVVVSFETIEHHDQHHEMMKEIKRVLKPDGLLIISTPDKFYYSDKRNFKNIFHVKELYKQDFIDLIAKYFENLQVLTQKYCNGNSIIEKDEIENSIQFFSGNYTEVNYKLIDPIYVIVFASGSEFNLQPISIFDGNLIINKEILDHRNRSTTYKVGNFILFPFKFLKEKF
jgi:ubiquinone/menaquinone biosynthesis C-methylase UbiE